MSGAVYFLAFLIALGVLAAVIGGCVLLYLLIDDQLYKRKIRNSHSRVIKSERQISGNR